MIQCLQPEDDLEIRVSAELKNEACIMGTSYVKTKEKTKNKEIVYFVICEFFIYSYRFNKR
jgi:hypothetical protein